MKKNKLYFGELEEDRAYTLEYLLDEMKYRGLSELLISEAQRETGTNYFYCKSFSEVFIKPPEGEACGNTCGDYTPRNGKKGCCKYWGFCYIPGKEFKLTIDGKITPKI